MKGRRLRFAAKGARTNDSHARDPLMTRNYFHLHLVSDSTGETLIAVSRAVVAQYQGTVSIEHVYPLVRNADQLGRVINEIQSAPGIVLYTLVDQGLSSELQAACADFGAVSLSVLEPIVNLFHSYLGPSQSPRPGAQHMLNSEYFRRIDALNFTMIHDDGQMVENSTTLTWCCSASAAHRRRRPASTSRIVGSRPPISAGAGRADPAIGVPAQAPAGGRPAGRARAHRADPREPPAVPQCRRQHRLCGPRHGVGRDRPVEAPVQRAQMADDRRHPPLH